MMQEIIENQIDAYLEKKEADVNYSLRIEEKYHELLRNPEAVREAETWISGTFIEYESETTLLMHRYIHEGMTSEIERRLKVQALHRADALDRKLYEMAEDSIRVEDTENAWREVA